MRSCLTQLPPQATTSLAPLSPPRLNPLVPFPPTENLLIDCTEMQLRDLRRFFFPKSQGTSAVCAEATTAPGCRSVDLIGGVGGQRWVDVGSRNGHVLRDKGSRKFPAFGALAGRVLAVRWGKSVENSRVATVGIWVSHLRGRPFCPFGKLNRVPDRATQATSSDARRTFCRSHITIVCD
jgi:hypothetical protein